MTVQPPRRRNPATVAARPATSLETALTQALLELVALPGRPVPVDTLVAVEAVAGRNVTNAARSATSLVTAPRVAGPTAEVMEAAKEVTEVEVEDTEVLAKAVRPATPAGDMVTCHATVLKDRSATTVSFGPLATRTATLPLTLIVGGEVGHLSRDCPSEPSSERVCYKCKQPGHVQASCPN